ncbi:MAG: sigma-70 family RNA polymerase sigma factor [Clostridium sp.]|nr:sigma-70 family RNA polymerase sigma factor [Clostridium sp.]
MRIVRKKKSESALLEELFMAYRGNMYAAAFAILHNEAQAEDAVGDAFEKVIPHLHKFHSVESAKTKKFLHCAVKSAAIDIYRKNQREQGHLTYGEWSYLADSDNPIEHYIQTEAEQNQISTLKNMLPDHYWDMLYLKYFENLSVAEIAKKLDLSEENVYSRLRRARKKARELLIERSQQI